MKSFHLFSVCLLLSFLTNASGACELVAPSTEFVDSSTTYRVLCSSEDLSSATVTWKVQDTELLRGVGADNWDTSYTEPGHYQVFAAIQFTDKPEIILNHTTLVISPPTSQKPAQSRNIIETTEYVWSVNPDQNTVSIVNRSDWSLMQEITVGENPVSLVKVGNGDVWVVNQKSATITILNSSFSAVHTIALPYASRPYGICRNSFVNKVYVTLEATGKLLEIDEVSRAITQETYLFPFPRGLAVSWDGSFLLATQYATTDHTSYVIKLNSQNWSQRDTIPVIADEITEDAAHQARGVSHGLESISISPDGKYAFGQAIKSNVFRGHKLDGKTPTFETVVRTILYKIDLQTNQEVFAERVDLDNHSHGSFVTLNQNGRIFSTAQGSNFVVTIDLNGGLQEFPSQRFGDEGRQIQELAPNGILLLNNDSLLIVRYYLSREIGVYDVSSIDLLGNIEGVKLLPVTTSEKLNFEVLHGKQVFYNAADIRMSKDRYISCGTCHINGHQDKRVYDVTHLGEGFRKTTSLLGKKGLSQGLLHFSANFDEIQDFEHPIRDFFRGEGFIASGDVPDALGALKTGRNEDLDALASYVTSLSEVNPSPYRNGDGSLTASAKRGKALFESSSVGCVQCHTRPNYTISSNFDNTTYDVGTITGNTGPVSKLDVPSLKGTWENAPYLHDGSAKTLREVLVDKNQDDKHGKTSHLSESQIQDLIHYLNQIDDTDGPMIVERIAVQGPFHLRVGDSAKLQIQIVPEALDTVEVQKHLSDSTILEFGNTGYVFAKEEGEVVLTLEAQDGSQVLSRYKIKIQKKVNPNTSETSTLESPIRVMNAFVYDINGKLMYTYQTNFIPSHLEWKRSNESLRSGVYLVRFLEHGKKVLQKMYTIK